MPPNSGGVNGVDWGPSPGPWYVRSSQCNVAGLFESGKIVSSAAATSASSSVANTASGSTSDESMTGDGKGYRGRPPLEPNLSTFNVFV